MDLVYSLFLVLGFLAVVLLLEGLYLAWNAYSGPEARRIERRLQVLSAGGRESVVTPLIRKRLMSEVAVFERVLLMLPRVHSLDRFLVQSGMTFSVGTFLAVCVALWLGASVLAMVLGASTGMALVMGGPAAAFWVGLIMRRRTRRMSRIGQQLADALDLMARAMQAGHAFSSAMRMVGSEGPQPIAQEFQTTFDELNFGIPLDQAMTNLAARVESGDLRFFVVAVMIQRETGGNLAEILAAISALIRDRQKLLGSIRVLSAEGRLSAWILTILPFALALAISFVNREFISRLWTDPVGVRMVGVALALMLLGVWWMWRLVKIRI